MLQRGGKPQRSRVPKSKRYHDLEQCALGHGLDSFLRQSLHHLPRLVVCQMASRTQRDKILRPAIHLDVVDVCHRQRSFVRVKFFAWKTTLQPALLTLPACLIFDRVRNLIPIVWVF